VENISGHRPGKTESSKYETEAVVTMAGTVIEWQNVENIRGQTMTKIGRIKEETEAVRTVIESQNMEYSRR
jgi:hypothetical protein